MLVKFWGVRGSIPAPIDKKTISEKLTLALRGAGNVDLGDPQAIEEYVASLPLEVRGTIGGNTPCVEVNTCKHHIILDAGSGLRELGLALMQGAFGRGEGVAHMFMSHTHWDHIQGFPFFLPAYVPGNRFFIYSPKKNIEEKFTTQQIDQDMFPVRLNDMAADLTFVTMDECGGRPGRFDGSFQGPASSGRVVFLPNRRKRYGPGLRHGRRIPQSGRGTA